VGGAQSVSCQLMSEASGNISRALGLSGLGIMSLLYLRITVVYHLFK